MEKMEDKKMEIEFEKTVFEIVNPSDSCTLIAKSLDVAMVAVSIIGSGKYSLKNKDRSIPFFLLGGQDEWCMKIFNKNFEQLVDSVFENKKEELIECLDSVFIGNEDTRIQFDETIKDETDLMRIKMFKKRFVDEHRTSLNNICKKAWLYAERLKVHKE